jgi:hypothetical protein|tara:strand:- start:148 stop:453 length:306 start_codon:yes stop_codon:yes gene_type:complete
MSFKLKPPFNTKQSPIYVRDLEEGVLGKGNKNGTILISDKVSPENQKQVIDHEEVHVDQVKRGDLDYDDDNVYWKGKVYPRDTMDEGAKNLPWEAEAYKNS